VLVCFVGPTRCSTPVPQPLSVMNSFKAWNLNRFVGGDGVANVKGLVRRVCTVILMFVTFHERCDVSFNRCFWQEKLKRLK